MALRSNITRCITLFFVVCLFLSASVSFAQGQSLRIQRDASGVSVLTGDTVIRLDPWLPSVVRVRIAPVNHLSADLGPAVIGSPAPGKWTIRRTNKGTVLDLDNLSVQIDKADSILRFDDKQGRELLEDVPSSRRLVPAADAGHDGLSLSEVFNRNADERYFGMGVVRTEDLNAVHGTIDLTNRNTEIRIPMLYSRPGYGILWNNPSRGSLSLTPSSVTWNSTAGDEIDYFVMSGPSADQVIASYRSLTGQAPLLPRWAYGFWFSRNRFRSQKEILDVAQSFKEHGFPLDALFQDYFYWAPTGVSRGEANWGSHEFAADRYPDPKAMIQTLHDRFGVHFLPVVWAKFNPSTANGKELASAGALFPPSGDWAGADMRYYDPFIKRFRDLYGKQLAQDLFSLGIDGVWLDGAEPEIDPNIFGKFDTPDGPVSRVADAFPLLHTTAVHDAMRKAEPEKRVVLVPRSAWAGEQRNGAVIWTGDIRQNWEDFRWQIDGLQNFSISGLPYITTDVGGYSPRPENDVEHFVRWYEWGTFCPILRVHGLERGLPWQYGRDGEQILLNFDLLRHRLMPYIYSEANRITTESGTLMRPLVMDFRTDAEALQTKDEYMFGPSFLVAPITRSHYTELPAHPEQWSDSSGKAGSLSMSVSGGEEKSIAMPASEDLTASPGIEQDVALKTAIDPTLTFQGSFTPSATGKIDLRFITRSAGSVLTIGQKSYRQDADFEFLTVQVPAQKGVAIPFSLKTTYRNPAFRVLQDDFPDGRVERPVYLPRSDQWYDFWTGDKVASGTTIAAAGLSEIPLYMRAGSIVPLDQIDKTKGSGLITELRVYRGSNAHLNLYDDSGDGYGYEKGERSIIPIKWDESHHTLTIGKRQGSYPGMSTRRIFRIVWVKENHGSGIAETTVWDREIAYSGSEMKVRSTLSK